MTSKLSIQFLTDENGQKTAAVIPIEEWLEYSQFMNQYLAVKDSIKRGLQDVNDIKSGKITPQSIESFLDEL